MAHPSPNAISTSLVSVLPLTLAVVGTASAVLFVPSDYPVAAAALVAVAWAGWLCSLVARRVGRAEGAASAACSHDIPAPSVVDEETGFGNEHQLPDHLNRQIAVFRRYSQPGALVTIEVRPVGFRPDAPGDKPPSPAPYVAAILRDLTRAADVILRVEETRFAIVMPESTKAGADAMIERIINRAAAAPFARNTDGSGIRAQVWAGAAELAPGLDQPLDYLESALADMSLRAVGRDGLAGGRNTFTLPVAPLGVSR